MRKHRLVVVAGLAGILASCDEPIGRVLATEPAKPPMSDSVTLAMPEDHSFRCLDDFLSYLKAASAADSAYYEKTGPDSYVLRGGAPLAVEMTPEVLTREDLMRKYGFSC